MSKIVNLKKKKNLQFSYICLCNVLLGNLWFYHSHKKQIVWKHRPNMPFFALMLRTKIYQNPFFFTGHQNVNKPKSRAARTVYGLIFLLFYKIIVSFFSFLCQDASKTRSNCAIIGCNLSKKYKLTLYKTQNGESRYVDHKFLFNFNQELPTLQNLGDRHPNTIELASCIFYLSGERFPFPPFHYSLGSYLYLFLLYNLLSQN